MVENKGETEMKQEYSRNDIENLILGIRGKKYSERQMKLLYSKVRDKIGQQLFNNYQVSQILIRTVSGQLFPQQNIDKVAEKLCNKDLQDFITYTSQLLCNIENIKKIKLPDTEVRDLNFLADAMVGCGLKRYSKATLQKKVRDYLKEDNLCVTQKYDYSCLSGATINGVLHTEYNKLHRLPWGLTNLSLELVERSRYLKEAIAVLKSVQLDLKVIPIMSNVGLSEDEKLKRAIASIKRDLAGYQSEDKMKLVCLRFIRKYGKSGRRKLSAVVHPDVCKDKNAPLFQVILNSCASFDDGIDIIGEIARLSKAVKFKDQRYKRPFHRSDKWQEYVERRKANGWHSRYYGDAIAV
ncbi:MAG: hypothetical protein ACKPA7_30880 [Sphaerospermopsis kisseleviana]